jgi:hypothetical protein
MGLIARSLEALAAERHAELAAEHLEGDGAVVAEIVRQVDRSHAPAAEFALERVAAQKRAADRDGARVHTADREGRMLLK